MTTDASLLLRGLEEYRAALNTHMHMVAQEYAQLSQRWQAFNHVFESDAAREFRPHWARTTQRFEEYIEASRRIGVLLDERIEALRVVNREGDLR
jgi:hypothetical protein